MHGSKSTKAASTEAQKGCRLPVQLQEQLVRCRSFLRSSILCYRWGMQAVRYVKAVNIPNVVL